MVAGSVPTENLPTKSHDAPKRERRQLVRQPTSTVTSEASETPPSTSGLIKPKPKYSDIEEFRKQLRRKIIQPWSIEDRTQAGIGDIWLKLDDKTHSVPQYTVIVNHTLEFSVFAFNWPVPDHHSIYKDHKRSVKYMDICELLQKVRDSGACKGMPATDIDTSFATNPTGNPDPNPNTIVRHTIPKAIQDDLDHPFLSLQRYSVSVVH